MIVLLVSLAWAGRADFPLRASVSCPEQGVCRVLVPPHMSATGAGLLLEDAQGEVVPSARLSYLEAPERWAPVSATKTEEGGSRLAVSGPVSAVRVSLASGPPQLPLVQLRTRSDAGAAWWEGKPHRLTRGEPLVLPLADPEARQVELVGPSPRQISVEVGALGAVREVSGVVETHDRWAVITLSEPATVRRLTLPGAPDGAADLYGWLDRSGVVEPTYLGTYPCQDGVLVGAEATGRRFAVSLPEPAAAVSVARAWAPREVLLVRDAGAMTLYGGADEDQDGALQAASGELLALPWTGATVAASQPNPDHTGGLSLLMAPGTPIEAARFRFSRAISGSGLVRIPLPAPMLLQVHRDLRDLRVLDADGRQIPYAIVDEVGEDPIEPASVAQDERPGVSRVTLSLPRADSGELVLVLSTPARGFSRPVSVRSGRGTVTRTWEGGAPLRVVLDGPIGDTITIAIDNGDDPPLPLEVSLLAPRRSLLAQVGEGSRLVYGDRSVLPADRGARLGRRKRKQIAPISAPQYDLRRHGAALLREASGVGRVGPEQPVLLAGEGPEQQRILIATVLAALVMVGVLGRVLLGASGADRDQGGGGA